VFTPLLKRECSASSLRHRELEPQKKRCHENKTTNQQTNEFKGGTPQGAAVKTLSLQVAITEPDLSKAVRQAFDLAKGAGRELNLAFDFRPGR
jgi:hypothetical protein